MWRCHWHRSWLLQREVSAQRFIILSLNVNNEMFSRRRKQLWIWECVNGSRGLFILIVLWPETRLHLHFPSRWLSDHSRWYTEPHPLSLNLKPTRQYTKSIQAHYKLIFKNLHFRKGDIHHLNGALGPGRFSESILCRTATHAALGPGGAFVWVVVAGVCSFQTNPFPVLAQSD